MQHYFFHLYGNHFAVFLFVRLQSKTFHTPIQNITEATLAIRINDILILLRTLYFVSLASCSNPVFTLFLVLLGEYLYIFYIRYVLV